MKGEKLSVPGTSTTCLALPPRTCTEQSVLTNMSNTETVVAAVLIYALWEKRFCQKRGKLQG